MTRGRTPTWAETPLADWIRARLDGREKQWLAAELIERGRSADAADQAVNRWTYLGQPKTAARLTRESIEDLTAIFGEEPPGVADVLRHAEEASAVRSELDELRRRVEALEARRPHGAPPQPHEPRQR